MLQKKSRMFTKRQRIRDPKEFQNLLASGKKFLTPFFVLKYKTTNHLSPRLGIVVSKKKISRAIDRNRLKRLAREVFRTEQASLRALDYLVSFRPEAARPGVRAEVILALRGCLRGLNRK